MPVTSLDAEITHSLFDQLRGVFLLSEYEDQLGTDRRKALLSLDLACEFNLFEALITRCELCVLEAMKKMAITKIEAALASSTIKNIPAANSR